MFKKSFLVLLFILINNLLAAEQINYSKFDNGNDSWPIFNYPSFLKISNDSYKGEKNKWIAILESEEKNIIIEISPYGFVTELYKTENGFDSPRDVILIENIKNITNIKRTAGEKFEIIIEEVDNNLRVFFIKKNPEWGLCYNTLFIKYKDGDKAKYGEIFNHIINSFQPSFIER